MKNISKTPQILANEKGELSVSEFIIGMRFSINVDQKQITIDQDTDFNMKRFNKTLDLDSIFSILNNIYNFDIEKLQMAPTNEYTIDCIYYDKDLMENMMQIYRGKGIIIVSVKLKNGNFIPQDKISSFCSMVGIPTLKPMFVGNVDQIRDRFAALKAMTEFSYNKLSGGIVIRNEPCQIDKETNKPKIWFVEPDTSISVIDSSESPVNMAHEFVFTTLTQDVIQDFIETTKLDPISNKKAFKLSLFNYLKENFAYNLHEYMNRCNYFLGNEKPEYKFDILIRKEITYYVNNVLLPSKKFKNRKIQK